MSTTLILGGGEELNGFTFHPLNAVVIPEQLMKESFPKWNIDKTLCVKRFRYDEVGKSRSIIKFLRRLFTVSRCEEGGARLQVPLRLA